VRVQLEVDVETVQDEQPSGDAARQVDVRFVIAVDVEQKRRDL
jgi:hypothetical protein